MTWLEDAARRLSGGRDEVCYSGHTHHARRIAETVLGTIEVFDASKYREQFGYCTGDDEVSRVLADHGTWEAHVLRALDDLDVLKDPAGGECVLDFGSRVGWYSRLAARAGFDVLALDADRECLDVTAANTEREVERNDRELVLCHGWLDEHTRTLELPDDGTTVRLVKADVESAELHVVRSLSRLLDAHVVEWVLLEISPVFRDDYLETVVEPLRAAGYEQAWRLHPSWRVWDEPWVLDFAQEEILWRRSS